MWLLGYKYFVHLSIWTKCLSDGVENGDNRTALKFQKNFSNDNNVTQQKFISQLVIQDETYGSTTSILIRNGKAYKETNESVKIVISLHCIYAFFPCHMQTTDDH